MSTLFPFAVVGVVYEIFARSGYMKPVLTPSLINVAETFERLVMNGDLLRHAAMTLMRMGTGFIFAAAAGILIGTLMARVRIVDRLLTPVVAIGLPIPGLAWVPLFILWFGLGETATILLVAFSSAFPIIVNVRMGVMAINPVWIRAARIMETPSSMLFRKVVLPGALPLIVSGLRSGFARAWRVVVAGEMIAATSWGLGWAIFNAMEVLNTDVVIAVIIGIAITGYLVEVLLFSMIERRYLVRWGMMREVRG
jgi:ABC-type nitrate/sulfonate/bicarbonate transport system permease component